MLLDKHTLVTHVRNDFNEVVAVIGDGTNDAQPLHEADICLAMDIAGTEVCHRHNPFILDDFHWILIVYCLIILVDQMISFYFLALCFCLFLTIGSYQRLRYKQEGGHYFFVFKRFLFNDKIPKSVC